MRFCLGEKVPSMMDVHLKGIACVQKTDIVALPKVTFVDKALFIHKLGFADSPRLKFKWGNSIFTFKIMSFVVVENDLMQ